MSDTEIPQTTLDEVPEDALVLDVRDASQWAAGHAPNAVHIPIAELPDRLDEVRALIAQRPEGSPLPVTCGGGTKGKRATALLREQGLDAAELRGGMRGWAAQGRAVSTD